MTTVTFENVSSDKYHRVRLTPTNGESVDPTSLTGAAIWGDELLMCLAPPVTDDSCYGTTDIGMFRTEGTLRYSINDIDYGFVNDYDMNPNNIVSITVSENGYCEFTNLSDNCIRITISTGDEGIAFDSSTVNFNSNLPEPFHTFYPDSPQHFDIHLSSTRINKVAIDSQWADGTGQNSGVAQNGGSTITYSILTNTLLPSDGLALTINGEPYVIPYGTRKTDFQITLPTNPTNYSITYTPTITFDNPALLIGGVAPGFTPVTIRAGKFNRNSSVNFISFNQTVPITADSDAVDFQNARLTTDTTYTMQFDSSFAGARLYTQIDSALNPYLGTIDSTGKLTFTTPKYWLVRNNTGAGFFLTDNDEKNPFFWFSGLIIVPSEPYIATKGGGNFSSLYGTVSNGFDGPFQISSIPAEINEIIVSSDKWQGAPADVTPFNTAKRITRNSNGYFIVPVDKPQRTYSSDVDSMSYYLNYIQITFVINDIVTNKCMWKPYRLNVGP